MMSQRSTVQFQRQLQIQQAFWRVDQYLLAGDINLDNDLLGHRYQDFSPRFIFHEQQLDASGSHYFANLTDALAEFVFNRTTLELPIVKLALAKLDAFRFRKTEVITNQTLCRFDVAVTGHFQHNPMCFNT